MRLRRICESLVLCAGAVGAQQHAGEMPMPAKPPTQDLATQDVAPQDLAPRLQDAQPGFVRPPLGTIEGEVRPSGLHPLLFDIQESVPFDLRPTLYLHERGPAGTLPGTERWIVTFWRRSFDVGEFRRAVHDGKPASEVARIVAGLEEKARREQADFALAIAALGGRVTQHWWIINGCAIEIPRHSLVILAAAPNIAVLEPDRVYEPVIDPALPFAEPMILVATNAANHNADAVQATGLRGHGLGCAIMDTGQDGNMAGTGQAHRTYFRDGIKPGINLLLLNRQHGAQPAEDTHGHGTGVAGVACGARWSSANADHGHAYNAYKLGYSICDIAGSCSVFDATRVAAWQQIAADKVQFNIRSANNSYSGSPSPINAVQQALDAVAFNSDVFIANAAGNGGASTAGSQSTANGLAVAACNATTKTIAGFSSRGPLSGDPTRFYPDITACGVSTVMPLRDNEGGNYVASGTSMASPQVCGAAILVREANSTLTALETKSVLLASTEDISAQNPTLDRNAYGMGFLRDDLAVALARQDANVFTDSVGNGVSRFYDVYVTSGNPFTVAISWHRVNFTTTAWNNLDLFVRTGGSGGPIVGTANSPRNLYEMVRMVAPITGTLTIEVRGTAVTSPTTQVFALAHTGFGPTPTPRPDCHVVPISEATRMSNSNNAIPFSWSPARYQQVFLGSEVSSLPINIHTLALRQDNGFGGLAGATVDLEIKVGDTTLAPATLTGTFAANFNLTAPLTVLPRTNIVLPTMPPSNQNPAEFFLGIPFVQPFPFAPVAGRNLIVDVTQRGNSVGNAIFMYPLDAVSGGNTTRLYGFPDTALTGTLGVNYGLVMCLQGPTACRTVPAAAAEVMGNSNNSIPFSWTPTRYQQVFLASELGSTTTLIALGLRQDNGFGGLAGATIDVEVIMGPTTFAPATLTTTFASNFTGTQTTVVPRQNFNLPTMGPVSSDPTRILFKLPFGAPFPFNGISNALVEVHQRGNSNGNALFIYPLDAHSGGNTTRLWAPAGALTGTLGVNYGLVMCFDTN